MTLDEAIKHCEEVRAMAEKASCELCADEHRQLAEWLKELKEYRKQTYLSKRIEYGTDGNPYEMSITNGKEYEEVTPVQNAHWTLYHDYKNMIDYPQCDNCGAVIKLPLPIDNLNFCPNCGRKIEEENESACL